VKLRGYREEDNLRAKELFELAASKDPDYALAHSFVALADLRAGSPTELATVTLRLSGEEPAGLFIPPGVAHGFFAETAFTMVYLVDTYFDASDELGVAWDDPDLGIDWPASDPILSARDRLNPSLADIRRDLPLFNPSLG